MNILPIIIPTPYTLHSYDVQFLQINEQPEIVSLGERDVHALELEPLYQVPHRIVVSSWCFSNGDDVNVQIQPDILLSGAVWVG
jgi:hypothetical protein